jgi:hypothetical protein
MGKGDFKETKRVLKCLVDQQEYIQYVMKNIIVKYLRDQGKINSDIEEVPYKKIIREEFGLVI